ncbi:MAG: MFS transporter [Pseudomonadota bacterium]
MNDRVAIEDSWAGLLGSRLFPRFILLCFAVWLHAANSMLAATTLPSAVSELGGAHLISWAFTLYLLGSILAGASAGLVSQRLSLRSGFAASASLYCFGSAVCALAWQMEIVLAGRFLQGLGGGSLLALAYIALARIFPDDLMPRLMAAISVVWSTSAFCGPLIGGSFSTLGLWRFGYWAFGAQALVFVILALLMLSKDVDEERSTSARIPALRLVVLSAAILCVSLAGAAVDPLRSPFLCFVGLGLLFAFLRLDKVRTESHMYPSVTTDLSSKTGIGLFMIFSAAAATMSFLVFGPILLETLYAITPLQAGYVVALEAVAWGVAAIFFSNAPPRAEPGLIRAGTLCVALSSVCLAFAMPSGHLWLVVLCGAGQGAGFGMMHGFVVRRLVAAAPEAEKDVTASSIPTTQQISFALGAAAAGIVANAAGFADGASEQAAKSAAFWVFIAFAPVSLASVIAAWRLTRPGP